MKKNIILSVILLLWAVSFSAQQFNLSPTRTPKKLEYKQQMLPEQHLKKINEMEPEERATLVREFRENMMISELNISPEKQKEFRTLYGQYQEKQRAIKSNFYHQKNYETMSGDEARKKLEQSFEIGQELLNSRKEYSEKFMQIISPQQLLKMYDTEGAIRSKIIGLKDRNRENSESKK